VTGGPLADLRVIDLTQMLAGPYCTMLLADLGAEVIKVEPMEGDSVRHQGPFLPDDEVRTYGGYFQSVNRNKRSLALDLRDPAGREIVLELIDGASVVVENYREGVMDRLGLGYETLAARNPKLVYAAIRGFGDARTGSSPYKDWPAFDVVAQAMGGLVAITGPDADHPTKSGPGVGDIFPAALAAIGLLAALRHAESTGEGQFVDVAMYDGVLALCERIAYQHSYTGAVPTTAGNGHPLLCPFDIFPAADGWVAVAAPHDHFWVELCHVMGRPEMADDARYATNVQRVAHRDDVVAAVTAWTGSRRRAEITAALGGRVPCGPVNTADTIFADPHVAARHMLVDVEQPDTGRNVKVVGTPIKMTATPSTSFRRAPRLSEDADEILADLGYDLDQIAKWRSSGVVA
jgi:crotonobetainyl-CoA:carnitine CoA-transferase CaiB-like acyl-CoA transferase